MKKLLSIVLILILALGLFGCNKSNTGEEKKEKIVLGLAWSILDDGQTNLTNAIIKSMEEDYPDIEIEYTLTNADGDISKLISDVESLIALNPDLIYIMNSVGDEGIIPAIDACRAAGIKVGIGVAIQGDADYDYLYEGFDQISCGKVQAQYMIDNYDADATYNCAYILGDAGNTAGMNRRDGFVKNFVDVYDNATLVIEGNGNWNTDTSQALAEDWLIAHPEINVIACANDDECQGVINACKAAGRDDIIVLGIDGSDIGRANVAAGDQAMTCAISFSGVAKACLRTMIECVRGEVNTKLVSLGTENLEMIIK